MLTQEENELLARVGPGTPCGELMRRYWHPFAAAVQLDDNPVHKVRLLGEDLVLYRDRSGTIGLVGDRCIHRAVHLEWGIPEEHGLRCPYHGWLYNESGQCTEQPLEPPDSTFPSRIKLKSYRVQEMGGLLWAYMGPEPAPLLPQWDLCVREASYREVFAHWLPCNWLQSMENRGDLGHGIYLHGRLYQYALERKGELTDDPNDRWNAAMRRQYDKLRRGVYTRWRPIYNELGFSKGQRDSDQPEDTLSWHIGSNPIMFPYHLAFGPSPTQKMRRWYQIGVPIDDYTTWHITYVCWTFPPEVGLPPQTVVPYTDIPLKDENGETILDYVLSQDMVAWWGQGELTDRSREHLATSDVCVIAYRKLLKQQIDIVLEGGEPMNVFRDSERAWKPELRIPCMEDSDAVSGTYLNANRTRDASAGASAPRSTDFRTISSDEQHQFMTECDRYSQNRDLILEWYRRSDELYEQKVREQATAQA